MIGVTLVHLSAYVLRLGLAYATGAMIYIISHEIIPEPHRNRHQDEATTGLLAGLILMMPLDVILG